MGGVTLDVIMVQFQRMDARLDTLTDELSQVNTRVSHIAKRQACLDTLTDELSQVNTHVSRIASS